MYGSTAPSSPLSKSSKVHVSIRQVFFSRSGQVAYMIFLFVVCCLCLATLIFELVRSGLFRGNLNIKKLQPVPWVEAIDGFIDLSFVCEVAFIAYVHGLERFYSSFWGYFDTLFALLCVGSFVAYIRLPTADGYDGSFTTSCVYVLRQLVRFVRLLFFFSWFSNSYVDFKGEQFLRNEADEENADNVLDSYLRNTATPREYLAPRFLPKSFLSPSSPKQLDESVDQQTEEEKQTTLLLKSKV